MTLRSSDLQSDSDLDSTRNSCDVFHAWWKSKVVQEVLADIKSEAKEGISKEINEKKDNSYFRLPTPDSASPSPPTSPLLDPLGFANTTRWTTNEQ